MLIKIKYSREDDSIVWDGLVDTNRPPFHADGREITLLSVRLSGDQVQAVINDGVIPIIVNEKLTLTIERLGEDL